MKANERKTGILTFSRSLNYGSCLQTWSLVKVLQKMGVDPEIIDYQPKGYKDIYAVFRLPQEKRWVAFDFLHLCLYRYFYHRKIDFQRFWDRFYTKTDNMFDNSDSLRKQESKYDIIICGSDQIWNPKARDFDIEYLLPYVSNITKISYAVSINSGKVEGNVEFQKWLNEFDYLSVREHNSQLQIKQLLGKNRDIQVCLDPTLLLQAEDFQDLLESDIYREPYIFYYSVKLSENSMRAVECLAQLKKMPIMTLISGTGSIYYLKHKRNIKLPKRNVGPGMFLSLVKRASYIVTDSFHGTAFSIIYHKQFCAMCYLNKDGKIQYDYRLRNLLDLVDLSDRYVLADQMPSCIDKEIDWNKVDQFREKEAELSLKYLSEALSTKTNEKKEIK